MWKGGNEENSKQVDAELQAAVEGGDGAVVPAGFVGEAFVEVGAVGLEDILAAVEAYADGHDAVDGVEGGEEEEVKGTGALPAGKKGPRYNEGKADAADVAGKTAGFFSEIEPGESEDGGEHAWKDCR